MPRLARGLRRFNWPATSSLSAALNTATTCKRGRGVWKAWWTRV
jgi:hypothetical protein